MCSLYTNNHHKPIHLDKSSIDFQTALIVVDFVDNRTFLQRRNNGRMIGQNLKTSGLSRQLNIVPFGERIVSSIWSYFITLPFDNTRA